MFPSKFMGWNWWPLDGKLMYVTRIFASLKWNLCGASKCHSFRKLFIEWHRNGEWRCIWDWIYNRQPKHVYVLSDKFNIRAKKRVALFTKGATNSEWYWIINELFVTEKRANKNRTAFCLHVVGSIFFSFEVLVCLTFLCRVLKKVTFDSIQIDALEVGLAQNPSKCTFPTCGLTCGMAKLQTNYDRIRVYRISSSV